MAYKKRKDFRGDFFPLKQMYKEGMIGFMENLINPYSSDSPRYKEWERGYDKAYFINLKRMRKNAA